MERETEAENRLLKEILARRAAPAPPDPPPLGALVPPAIEAAQRLGGPLDVGRRIRAAILAACPAFETDPYLYRVVDSVASGRVPEECIAQALERFRHQIHLGKSRPSGPINDSRSYLAVVLRDELRRHGVAWTPLPRSDVKAG